MKKGYVKKTIAVAVTGGLLVGILTQFITARLFLNDPTWFLIVECISISVIAAVGMWAAWTMEGEV